MSWRRFRAIRGATTVLRDDPCAIIEATRELLEQLVEQNALTSDELVSVIFSATPDLTSEFPARAARDIGWHDVSLLCTTEMAVEGSLPRCIRVLLHIESMVPRERVTHLYLRDAAQLRPDLTASSRPPTRRDRAAVDARARSA